MQVGVADTASFNTDESFIGPRIGDEYGGEFDGLSLGGGDDAFDCIRHGCPPLLMLPVYRFNGAKSNIADGNLARTF